jgi:hypothetical protein
MDMPDGVKVPVKLEGSGLTAHTAIIAQSGSGKSFMLGRFLEEIASKTKARILILDPNSDFVKLGQVEATAWDRGALKPWFGEDDTREKFTRRWQSVGVRILTVRDAAASGLQGDGVEVGPISLSWPQLTMAEKAAFLGLPVQADLDQFQVLKLLGKVAEQFPGGPERCTWDRWLQVAERLATIKETDSIPTAGEWPGSAIDRLGWHHLSLPAILGLQQRLNKVDAYRFWDLTAPQGSLSSRVGALHDPAAEQRVLDLDLGSLATPEARFLSAAVALDALWGASRQAWIGALQKPADQDTRCPVFVVIDEAHNLAPEQPSSEIANPVIDILVRIAMEGRKYGLFLILVTQRPSRVNSSLLSQCDNLCLLKMSNPADIKLVEKRFGFVPGGWAQRALQFKKGEVLLSGTFVERPVYAHVSPRRTVEGGRSLNDAAWLTDPLSQEQGS